MKKFTKHFYLIFWISLIIGMASYLSFPANVLSVEPNMADYTQYPIFQTNAVAPNVLIILDNSGSMNSQAYTGNYDHNKKYYGYFEPYKKYSYASNLFSRDTSGNWDGNFLNWLTMRRVDIARKVIMGGLATSRTGGGNQTLIAEDSSGWGFTKNYTDNDGVTPYTGKTISCSVSGGNFEISSDSFTIKVAKDQNTYPDESPNFFEGNLAGVLQKLGDQVRWGNEFFNTGTGKNLNGGRISNTIGTNLTTLITDLQNTPCDTWTPLAEAYYVAMKYFMQEDIDPGFTTLYPAIPNNNTGQDPYYDGEYIYCAKSFVIMLTDGASTKDANIPDKYKDYDNDGKDLTGCDEGSNSGCNYPLGGTDYLDDVALYARTNDLRSDLDGEQNMLLYTIYAFGTDPDARQLLKDAAKNGGFEDKNGNKIPDLQFEYDEDGDGDPDTFYEAQDGYALEANLLKAINDILKRAASGTAVSVLSTRGEGEGNIIQAYFKGSVSEGTDEISWIGYLHSLWLDSFGNIREDTDLDKKLDVEKDRIIQFFTSANGETKVKLFTVSSSNPYPDTETSTSYIEETLEGMKPIWEAGERLSNKFPDNRNIYTYVNNSFTKFHPTNVNDIQPYLGVKDGIWSYLGTDAATRAKNLVEFIRGKDGAALTGVVDVRNRTLGGKVWKLGDIVHSTPVAVAKPPENYGLIYGDESYQNYYNAYKNRETVVYVGANDGMLHAFTSWEYDKNIQKFKKPATAPATELIGDELWAYIPNTLLPHLKWLADPDYTHVYYMDLKTKIFDARIFPDDKHYTDTDTQKNWGTILICGMRTGGAYIWSEDDFDSNPATADEFKPFYPGFAAIDITDPRNPELLWDISFKDLGLGTNIPSIVKVGNEKTDNDKWYAIFTSGPTNYAGESSQKGHVFVVDLETGIQIKDVSGNDYLFETNNLSYLTTSSSLDKNVNYSVDAIYFGETYKQGVNWNSNLYRISVPAMAGGVYDDSVQDNYSANPDDATYPWLLKQVADIPAPLTAPCVLSVDQYDNTWFYVGTGRYFNDADKVTTDQQYIFGFKDPFYNREYKTTPTVYYHNYGTNLILNTSMLFSSDDYTIYDDGTVDQGMTTMSYDDMLDLVRAKDGWYRLMPGSGERTIEKSAILGGVVLTPSFIPNDDICGFGGTSKVYGLYFESGTAYKKAVFNPGVIVVGSKTVIVESMDLEEGISSSVGLHLGKQEGATGYIQKSTGNIIEIELDPALNIKSGFTGWIEK